MDDLVALELLPRLQARAGSYFQRSCCPHSLNVASPTVKAPYVVLVGSSRLSFGVPNQPMNSVSPQSNQESDDPPWSALRFSQGGR